MLFSPYKDVTINMNWNTNVMQTKVTGAASPVVGPGSVAAATGLSAVTLAFATGPCGSENWGGVPGAAFAAANIPALNAAGTDYVVSTGGAAGAFTCSTAAGLKSFIDRYAGAHLVGIDFDIESGQSPAQIQALVSAVAAVQSSYPQLRFSFTLATLAASDGSNASLNSMGDTVVKAIKAAALSNYTINLMVMDYGPASTAVCVVKAGSCDMGQSAIQAARNLQQGYGIGMSHIELTPMIGLNDVVSETFTLADVDTVTSWAVANGIAGVHIWSLDRDTPCALSNASPVCSSVTNVPALGYTQRFLANLGQAA